jgi:hypothetical protein
MDVRSMSTARRQQAWVDVLCAVGRQAEATDKHGIGQERHNKLTAVPS